MADRKMVDDSHTISAKRGNGLLRREIWIDTVTGNVTRYNLAYINHAMYGGDNGRVVGCDNAHAGHHRHYKGNMEPVRFISFEHTEKQFEQAWLAAKDEK